MNQKKVHIQYFASFRDQAGVDREELSTECSSALELYEWAQRKYGFKLSPSFLKLAVNESFEDLDYEIQDGDIIVFLPPVAGG